MNILIPKRNRSLPWKTETKHHQNTAGQTQISREDFRASVGSVSPSSHLSNVGCVVCLGSVLPVCTAFLSECPILLASPVSCGHHGNQGFTCTASYSAHSWGPSVESDPDKVFPDCAVLWSLCAGLHDPVICTLCACNTSIMWLKPSSAASSDVAHPTQTTDAVFSIPLRLHLENHYPGQPVPEGHCRGTLCLSTLLFKQICSWASHG